jgi:hypothetical protein
LYLGFGKHATETISLVSIIHRSIREMGTCLSLCSITLRKVLYWPEFAQTYSLTFSFTGRSCNAFLLRSQDLRFLLISFNTSVSGTSPDFISSAKTFNLSVVPEKAETATPACLPVRAQEKLYLRLTVFECLAEDYHKSLRICLLVFFPFEKVT